MRVASLAAIAIVLSSAPGALAQAPQPRASLPDIEDEVMCTVCGTSLQLAQSPQAERERDFIRRLIAEGKTKDEIKDALVAEYGEPVLATPDDSGFDLAAWLLPIAGFGVALLGGGFALASWRRRGDRGGPAATAPAGEEAERLDADIANYDL